tara:strand:+ start:374 stop:766 length:393 start_codon:yes stop_codon:yes gene_type:complete
MSKADNLAKFQTTITDGTTSVATSFVTNGSAKAWMTMTGDGSAIDDSFNTSSLSDNGVGDFTQNYSNAFGNVHYSWCGQQETTFSGSGVIISHQHTGKAVSSTVFITFATSSGSNTDTDENCTQVHGDLA